MYILITFNEPFTVVVAPASAILTAPLVVAKEVAPVESNVETLVSPLTSKLFNVTLLMNLMYLLL